MAFPIAGWSVDIYLKCARGMLLVCTADCARFFELVVCRLNGVRLTTALCRSALACYAPVILCHSQSSRQSSSHRSSYWTCDRFSQYLASYLQTSGIPQPSDDFIPARRQAAIQHCQCGQPLPNLSRIQQDGQECDTGAYITVATLLRRSLIPTGLMLCSPSRPLPKN